MTKRQCGPDCPAPGCYTGEGCGLGMGNLGSMADWRDLRDWVLFDARAAERYRALDGLDGEHAWYEPDDGGDKIWSKVKRWYDTTALIKYRRLQGEGAGEEEEGAAARAVWHEEEVCRSRMWRVAPDVSSQELATKAQQYRCFRNPPDKEKQFRFEIRKAKAVVKEAGHVCPIL